MYLDVLLQPQVSVIYGVPFKICLSVVGHQNIFYRATWSPMDLDVLLQPQVSIILSVPF